MLISRQMLGRIRDGEVDLAFRRWKRARVLPGSRIRTAVGILEVEAVDVVEPPAIDDGEAARAGFGSAAELLARLERSDEGEIHRVRLRWAAPDPRVELRERADLDEEELAGVRDRLERMDAASRHGAWTRAVLELIAARPEVPAEQLAASLDREKLSFKRDVRKLKEIGLTESLSPGYRLSPRGKTVLEELRKRC